MLSDTVVQFDLLVQRVLVVRELRRRKCLLKRISQVTYLVGQEGELHEVTYTVAGHTVVFESVRHAALPDIKEVLLPDVVLVSAVV